MLAAFCELFEFERDWHDLTTAQPGLSDRRLYRPSGRILGGSSSMTAVMWDGDVVEDYDRWAELAALVWLFEVLPPHFRRLGTSPARLTRNTAPLARSASRPRAVLDHRPAILATVEESGHAAEAANTCAPAGSARRWLPEPEVPASAQRRLLSSPLPPIGI